MFTLRRKILSQNNQRQCQNNLISNLKTTRKSRVCRDSRINIFFMPKCCYDITLPNILQGPLDLLRKMGQNNQLKIQKSWKVAVVVLSVAINYVEDTLKCTYDSPRARCTNLPPITPERAPWHSRSRRKNFPEGFSGWCAYLCGRYRSLGFQVPC